MELNSFLLALIITIMDDAFILFGWNRSIPQVNKTIILGLAFTFHVYKILHFSLQFQWLHSGGLQPGGLDKRKRAETDSGSGRTALTFKRIDQFVR